ncbi:MAG: hypothetical protein CVV49_12290 [Spirochaetae bacterium HGW-Spirochaetae-5]|nr:MAG: hypothetical protein CVV49_12290 [Spirochaetae bacterium HGW-Spirochaetae-5]
MKILVCVKQVADIESNLRLNASSSWIEEDNKIAYRMNRYDEYALEEALLIKDALKDTTIDVISVGPERAASTIRKSLEKGADTGIHIKSDNPALSAIETSSYIAAYAADKKYDILFAGVMSEDLMQSQVGPMIASLLTIPCAASSVKTELLNNSCKIIADLELEGGVIEQVEITPPCLITVQTGVNRPRYPSLSNVMRARSMEIFTIDSESLIKTDSTEKNESIDYPSVSSKGVVIEGTGEEKAVRLLDLLHEKGLL